MLSQNITFIYKIQPTTPWASKHLWQMATNLNVGWFASGKWEHDSKCIPNRLYYSV